MILQLGIEYINGNFIHYLDNNSGSEEERDMVKRNNNKNEFSHHIFVLCSKDQITKRIEKGCRIQTTLHMLF